MIKFYNFATRQEETVYPEQIMGIGLDKEGIEQIIDMMLQDTDIKVNRFKLTQLHWYLEHVSPMLMKLMATAQTSRLVLLEQEKQVLEGKYALLASEDKNAREVCFKLVNRFTGKEVGYDEEDFN